ncbi:MAG: hypothetical protein WD077_16295 [Bacteroidia bacterium]
MKTLKLICFVVVAGVAFTACSKEKRLEKRLTKKEGVWNITSLEYKYFADGALYEDRTFSNVGSFEFEETSGTMRLDSALFGDSAMSIPFTWDNTEDMVTVYTADFDTLAFTVETDEKKEQVWFRAQEFYNATADEDIREEFRYTLIRED